MEMSYAYYPVGGFYGEHVDVPKSDDGYRALGRSGTYFERREFSLLLYLNEDDWSAADGGELRMKLNDTKNLCVNPLGGTLVIFRSDAMPHEVLESKRERWTVVAWFATRRARNEEESNRQFQKVIDAGERWERMGFDKAAVSLYGRLIRKVEKKDKVRCAYAYVRKGHALYDGCDDRRGAAEAFRKALTLDESAVAWSGLGLSLGGDLECLRNAWHLDRNHRSRALCEAAGEKTEADLPSYLRETLRWGANFDLVGSGGTFAHLQGAANAAFEGKKQQKGLVLELGVFRGRSLRMLKRLCPKDAQFHAFDSFMGLPEAWAPGEPAGSYTTDGVVPAISDVQFHKGWFNETLPPFLKETNLADNINLVHLDCDLYSSTADALDVLGPHLKPGAVLVFDDFLAHPSWQQDQAKAFEEAVTRFHWDFRVLSASMPTKQVVIQLT